LKLKALRNLYLSFWGLLLISLSGSAWAIDPVYTGYFNDNAISGYDAVAYFTQGKPVTGSAEFTFDYMYATWKFSSQEHLDMFTGDPTAYAPQYGGYCAYAVANGDTASAEPDLWTIYEGKLYLNYSPKINARWSEDIPGYVEKANDQWRLFITE
jgi:YHS domain-containing protein